MPQVKKDSSTNSDPNEHNQVCVTVAEENENVLNEDTPTAGAGLVSCVNETIYIS